MKFATDRHRQPRTDFLVVLVLLVIGMMGVAARGADVEGRIVSLGIGGAGEKQGLYRAGTWVPVRVHVENRTGRQFVGRLGVEQPDLDGDKVMSIGGEVILPAGDVEGRDVWLYYWPRPDERLESPLSVVVMEGKAVGGGGGSVVGRITQPEDGETIRRERGLNRQRWVVVLGGQSMGFGSFFQAIGGTQPVAFSWVPSPRQLPDNVLGYDGVDVLVWQADEVRVSDFGASEFQLKAILDWVRAGGHLVISVSRQGAELRGVEKLRAALPMELTETRELAVGDLSWYPGLRIPAGTPLRGERLLQAVGKQKSGVRPVSGGMTGVFAEHPFAVTGLYGQGAVTLITVDMGNPTLGQMLSAEDWLNFWTQVCGWSGQSPTYLISRATYERAAKKASEENRPDPVATPADLRMGERISWDVDVHEVTATRTLVALLFLGLYWLAAGPIGHLVLRRYKVVHWSWWVFGGTVLVAAGVAGGVVTYLQLTNYDLRHKTVVRGTVGSKDVTVTGFYGIFAPRSGQLTVAWPESARGRLSYLAPLCTGDADEINSYADPQSYELLNEKPGEAKVVFRNTLKKLEGRWTGEREGIVGQAAVTGGYPPTLVGKLENRTGYDLKQVLIVVHAFSGRAGQGTGFVFKVGQWPKGGTIDLATDAKIQMVDRMVAPLENILRALAYTQATGHVIKGVMSGGGELSEMDRKSKDGILPEMLDVLLDAWRLDPLSVPGRIEPSRGLTRTMDSTKSLYAAGALIVAKAGDIDKSEYVKSPVPITVNDHVVEGKGEILFTWALPLEGSAKGGGMLGEE